MYQFRLSTLLLAFVVVWSALAVFGARGGVVVAAILLVIAAVFRSPDLRKYLPLVLLVLLCGLCLWGLPSVVMSAREASRRLSCQNNLKQIGQALVEYENANGCLPPAVVSGKQGTATHSWRVLILPCLDYGSIYNEYSLREPWNGPNNAKLATMVLPFYLCPSVSSVTGPSMTSYVAVTGPGTAWNDHRAAGRPLRVMVVEVANSNINWMEPRDLTLEEACRGVGDASRPCLASYHTNSGGFFFHDEVGADAVLSDGRVCFIPAGLPPETLRGLFTGNEKPRMTWERFPSVHRRRVNWTNCTALAVLILSYAVLLFRPRDKRSSTPRPPATAGGN